MLLNNYRKIKIPNEDAVRDFTKTFERLELKLKQEEKGLYREKFSLFKYTIKSIDFIVYLLY
ncbi:MAG: hypothetical protein JWQ57_3326 [Mucilaginibacter sp.]|nr:hypothetical protein [Mucilaginibacter sp.]